MLETRCESSPRRSSIPCPALAAHGRKCPGRGGSGHALAGRGFLRPFKKSCSRGRGGIPSGPSATTRSWRCAGPFRPWSTTISNPPSGPCWGLPHRPAPATRTRRLRHEARGLHDAIRRLRHAPANLHHAIREPRVPLRGLRHETRELCVPLREFRDAARGGCVTARESCDAVGGGREVTRGGRLAGEDRVPHRGGLSAPPPTPSPPHP